MFCCLRVCECVINTITQSFSYLFATMQRRVATLARLPILGGTEAFNRLQAALPAKCSVENYAAYSSVLKGIVTDPSLMSVPLDDHGFHRGHCVFDTCNVENGKAFGLSFHLERLFRSAQMAQILQEPPAPAFREEIKSAILQTIAATKRKDEVFVRYWLSAGRGDFAVSPKNCSGPTFYCVAHKDSHSATEPRGLKAATVDVPLKPPLLATLKSNNYLLNALVAMEADKRGGASIGVQFDAEGYLGESAVSTIAIVDANGVLKAPPAEAILPSTTWMRIVALSDGLIEKGLLTACSQEVVHASELIGCREMFTLGGGWIEPIVAFDDKSVGDGAPGPVFRALDTLVRDDFLNPDLTDDIPYDDA